MSRKPESKQGKGLQKSNRILLLSCLVLAAVMVTLLLIPEKKTYTYGGFTPPPLDAAAISGTPEVPAELGWSELQIRSGLEASVCGVLTEQAGQVAVWLYNHPDSDSWLKLRLTDAKGNVLGETGLLKPGEYVQYLTLDTVPKKDCTVILKVMGYAPETYYSAGSIGLQTTLQIGS